MTTDKPTTTASAQPRNRATLRTLRNAIGRTVTFHAYDNRDYRAHLLDVKNKIVSVQYYPISSAGTPIPYICTAYLDDVSRITI